MVWITYVATDGSESRVDVRSGDSLMMGAILNNVRGIDGECGGCLSCATCHVYVEPEWAQRLPEPDSMEIELLEGVMAERRPSSRLSCQISVTAELDGMQVLLPESQA
ncbi:2Fe-2S iron-sulfur cluster-binding protein [Pusillimonas noertemannii]|uniref:2Fe-2S ferredoxin n=1 Tax=Pusillimonas noertemannii TaxID=305977 RepID=A0A2U1CKW6_9BURK|nr:2Fe-2S iron-sulfur cluster-binding protein [Pusillimonas noertemannii]NYT69191.1 2Fe-2S iron-sulfur cluster binding domain-containing protein [Pusillimonas noertemannii]PVY61659.1 2Fe-2S ferredoxin [Pusillimonas noertemannii]TFL09600.1 2Fe-2S iron-sulfur cluster binding domain-containing protein [Pusillimonas noertemannii]